MYKSCRFFSENTECRIQYTSTGFAKALVFQPWREPASEVRVSQVQVRNGQETAANCLHIQVLALS